jgi:hypothetical protein
MRGLPLLLFTPHPRPFPTKLRREKDCGRVSGLGLSEETTLLGEDGHLLYLGRHTFEPATIEEAGVDTDFLRACAQMKYGVRYGFTDLTK